MSPPRSKPGSALCGCHLAPVTPAGEYPVLKETKGVRAATIARDVAGFFPARAAKAAEADSSGPSDGGCPPRG